MLWAYCAKAGVQPGCMLDAGPAPVVCAQAVRAPHRLDDSRAVTAALSKCEAALVDASARPPGHVGVVAGLVSSARPAEADAKPTASVVVAPDNNSGDCGAAAAGDEDEEAEQDEEGEAKNALYALD